MKNYARVINNIAIDVSTNPDEEFHQDIAKEFIVVPDYVKHGWVFNVDKWEAPLINEEQKPQPPTVSVVEFMLLFTNSERVAAKSLRSSDPMIDDFWSIIDDPRTTVINLSLSSVQEGVEYVLHAIGADVDVRKSEILIGVVK